MHRLTLIGAYGRTYTDTAKMLNDWNKGKDFKVLNGPYCSIRDLPHMVRLHDRVDLMAHTGAIVTIAMRDTVPNPLDYII